MSLLIASNLKKTYTIGKHCVNAVNDVSLSIKKAEFISVVGASGCGKSTLLHILGGVDRPDSGTVIINNTSIFDMHNDDLSVFRRRNIGIVYQSYNLIQTLTVEENILLPMRLDKRKIDESKFDNILETVGLKDRRDHLPNQLSGGQQQRCAIARALVNEPSIILADEPTGNLDSESTQVIITLLRKCNKDYNQAIMIVTHDNRVAAVTDRVISIVDGKIEQDKELL